MSDDLDSLKAENDALRKRMEKLEERVNPPPRQPSTHGPVDYTANASMPASAMQQMMNAVPDQLMSELRSDARKPNPVTQGANPQPQPQAVRGSGWRNEVPWGPQPGIAHVDRLVDAQDAKDKAELAMKLAKAGLMKKE
jgi:hypothetical protein